MLNRVLFWGLSSIVLSVVAVVPVYLTYLFATNILKISYGFTLIICFVSTIFWIWVIIYSMGNMSEPPKQPLN
jgi:hypothetical protein